MRQITAGPGDEETWPAYYGHPNDPRRGGAEAWFDDWQVDTFSTFEYLTGLSLDDFPDRDYQSLAEEYPNADDAAQYLADLFESDPDEFL